MAVSSRRSARNGDRISVEYPNIIRILDIKELASLKHQIKNYWILILVLVPFIPELFLNGQQLSDYQNFSNSFMFVWLLIVIVIFFIYSLRSNVVGMIVFDLKSQTVSKGRLRVVQLFRKEFIDKTFLFSSVKSIETNRDKIESTELPYQNLNIQMTFNNSNDVIVLLHLTPSGNFQSLGSEDWIKLFETAVHSQSTTTTDELTKDFKIQIAKIPNRKPSHPQ